MAKERPFYVRLLVQVLIWLVIQLVLFWFLNQRVEGLRRFIYSDFLFMAGAIEALTAGYWMIGHPYDLEIEPMISLSPGESTEEGRRIRRMDEFVRQRVFGTRLLAVGTLTIFIAIVMTYWPK